MLTASVTRVRRSVFPSRLALTSRCQIQDSAIVTHPADESRFLHFGQHHPAPYGPSPRRGPAGDTFHLSPNLTHRGTTHVEHDGWYLIADGPDLVRTQGSVQRENPHGSSSSWNNVIYVYGPPAVDKSPPSLGGFTFPAEDGLSSCPQSVNAHDPFTNRPNVVSGGGTFPQDAGPLMYPPYDAVRSAPAIEPSQSNPLQLSSGPQGQSLISNPNYVRSKVSALWQYLTFDFLRIQWHSI